MQDLNERSTPALMTDLVGNITDLFRKEVQLLRAEMSSKSTQIAVALGTLVAALVFSIVALNVLSAALVSALVEAGIPAVWSAVIVGGAIALCAIGLAAKGASSLKASNLAPERTARATMRDAEMIKEKV
ncbi:phage holin family protein [Amaricoccus macauensis]|uniref:phage holin family protein n=1 Tax=Amaricoccus macauensis TaxID=57001 RepID=UPI003C7BBFA5